MTDAKPTVTPANPDLIPLIAELAPEFGFVSHGNFKHPSQPREMIVLQFVAGQTEETNDLFVWLDPRDLPVDEAVCRVRLTAARRSVEEILVKCWPAKGAA